MLLFSPVMPKNDIQYFGILKYIYVLNMINGKMVLIEEYPSQIALTTVVHSLLSVAML